MRDFKPEFLRLSTPEFTAVEGDVAANMYSIKHEFTVKDQADCMMQAVGR